MTSDDHSASLALSADGGWITASYYDSIYQSTTDRVYRTTWARLVEYLRLCSATPHETKESAELISPHPYASGHRMKSAALETSLLIYDNDAINRFDDAVDRLRELGVASVVSTTASNQDDTKFRIYVPLPEPTDPARGELVWYSIAQALGLHTEPYLETYIGKDRDGVKRQKTRQRYSGLDSGKRSFCIYYLPGLYACAASNRFVEIDGAIHSADWWREHYPSEAETRYRIVGNRLVDLTAREVAIDQTKLMRIAYDPEDCPWLLQRHVDRWIDCDANRYSVAYKVLCSLAVIATGSGYYVAPDELLTVFAFVDDMRSVPYLPSKKRDWLQICGNAVQFALSHATLPDERRDTRQSKKQQAAAGWINCLTNAEYLREISK